MEEYESLIIKDNSLFLNAFKMLHVFRQNDELCDIMIRTDDGMEITAHRLVLSACSPYFRAMFTTNFLESTQSVVELKHINGIALRDTIDYFYTSVLHVHYVNVEEIIVLAHVLQVSDLLEKCEVYLRRNITPKNSLGLQAFAQHYSLENLKEHAMRYSCWNFNNIKDEEEFLLLPCHSFKELIAHDTLKAPSEEYILEALVKWVLYDFNNRKLEIQELLSHIRFSLMKKNYLLESDIIQYVKDNFPLSVKLITDALEYQSHKTSYNNFLPLKYYSPRAASEDIYVIGGWSNGQKLSTVQCFNVDTLQWAVVSHMNVAHVAKEDYFRVIVSDEELYTICFDKIMKYDHIDGLWKKVASGPEIQCKWAGVCEFGGSIYVVGGNSDKTSKRFNKALSMWEELPSMNVSRYYPGVAVMKGKLYVIGGLDNNWYPIKVCERFDPVRGIWEVIARMRTPRWSLGVAVLKDKLYAIGGSHSVEHFANTVEVYDPVIDSWERSIASMNYGRRCLGVAVVNNYIYVVGGRIANTIECYIKETNEWKVVGRVQTCCSFGCVALRLI